MHDVRLNIAPLSALVPLDGYGRGITGTHDLLAQLVDAVAVMHTGPGVVDGRAVVFRVYKLAEVVLAMLVRSNKIESTKETH